MAVSETNEMTQRLLGVVTEMSETGKLNTFSESMKREKCVMKKVSVISEITKIRKISKITKWVTKQV